MEEREKPTVILHFDADAFFASVEQVLRPELKGRPVIVGGSNRGVVSAASYEARRYGVRSAMPTVRARKLCPQGVFLKPDFSAYREFSSRMFAIIRTFSPDVEETSVDEGYVDLTGTLRLHRAPPWEVGHRILAGIRNILGINVSGGIAGTRCGAKMASELAKPNGLIYLDPAQAYKVLGNLPVGRIPGVGPRAVELLNREGIFTVRDLAAARPSAVQEVLGRWGDKVRNRASGTDAGPVRPSHQRRQKSYSADRTLPADTTDANYVRAVARELAERLATRLRADNLASTTVTFKMRLADFTDVSRSVSLHSATNANGEILDCLDHLMRKTLIRRAKIRQVGVRLSGIEEPLFQMDLFDPAGSRRSMVDGVVDRIRGRFGFSAIRVSGCW